MDSHIRVYIEANWKALGCLPPVAYKVLISLVQRADNLGRCFPSAERIAEDTNCHIETVWAALKKLEECRYIGYLRRNEQDIITGRWLPNVYLVSPYFVCIALEQEEDALRLWAAIYSSNPLPYAATLSEIPTTNQQQEPAPRTNKIESVTETNNNNQHFRESGEAGENPPAQKSPVEKSGKAEKANRKTDSGGENPENQQSEAPQRSKKRGGSAAAYKNPDPIAAPILDDTLEQLANRVNQLGVPIPLARGFVVGYGGAMVEAALLQVAAAKRAGQDIQNDGGFFRHLLQNNLVDKSLPEILTAKMSITKSWHDAYYSEES